MGGNSLAQTAPTNLDGVPETPKASGDKVVSLFSIYDGWTNAFTSDNGNWTGVAKTVGTTTVLGADNLTTQNVLIDGITSQNVSMMNKLHVDIWVSNAANDINKIALSFWSTPTSNWRGIDQTVVSNQWNSLDIDLSSFPVTLENVTALQVSGAVANTTTGEGLKNFESATSVYIANAYFYSDGTKVILTASEKAEATTENSVTLLAKAFKSNDASTDAITYTVTYEGNETGVTFNDGVSGVEKDLTITGLTANTEYTFTIKAVDAAGKEATKTVKVRTKAPTIAGKPDNVPGFVSENNLIKLYTKGKTNGFNWIKWGSDVNVGQDVEIKGEDNAFYMPNFEYYGNNLTKIENVAGMTLHVDVYPVNDIDNFAIIPIPASGNDQRGKTFSNLTANTWHSLELNISDYTNLITLEQIKYAGTANETGSPAPVNANGSYSLYIGNVYLYNKTSTEDKTPPTVNILNAKDNQINETDVLPTSVKVHFSNSDETKTNLKSEIWVKIVTPDKEEIEYPAASFNKPENNDNFAYITGLKPGMNYKLWIVVRDGYENLTKSAEYTFTTKSYTEPIKVANAETDVDYTKGGKVVLTGKWDVDAFNEIAKTYPAACYDMRNVDFTGYGTIDRGTMHIFNPNAYIIGDNLNQFNGGYAMPDKDGKLIGYNFDWWDGDFSIEGSQNDVTKDWHKTLYNEMDDATKAKVAYTVGSHTYIKTDPYTGLDVYFSDQRAALTRFMYEKESVDGSGFSNKYSTVICPFPIETGSDELKNLCEFYQLGSAYSEDDGSGSKILKLNFTKISGLTEANVPYLIKVKNGKGARLHFVDHNNETEKVLKVSDLENTSNITKDNGKDIQLFGTYVTNKTAALTTDTEAIYALMQNNDELKLMTPKPTDEGTYSITTPAFRAAVRVTKSVLKNVKAIAVNFDGETTGISTIDNDVVKAVFGNVYSIDGKKVDEYRGGMINLPAGLYIVNGKKIVVK